MSQTFLENKQNNSIEKSEAETQEEIARLRNIIEAKEKELESFLKSSSLKDEILFFKEKSEIAGSEIDRKKEKALEQEKTESSSEAKRELDYEDLSISRKIVPTKQQIKKISRQMKDADIEHQLSILINLAAAKNIYYAIKVVKKIGNACLADRFHDAIINNLWEKLTKDKKMGS